MAQKAQKTIYYKARSLYILGKSVALIATELGIAHQTIYNWKAYVKCAKNLGYIY